MAYIPSTPPPPPPPPIVQSCPYQIETFDMGRRGFKCVSETEHQEIINRRAQESEAFDKAIKWFFTRWQLYAGLILVGVLCFFLYESSQSFY